MEEDFTEKLAKVTNKSVENEIPVFKRPVIIGKKPGIRKVANNVSDNSKSTEETTVTNESSESDVKEKNSETIESIKESPAERTPSPKSSTIPEKQLSLPYTEPTWSGNCSEEYKVEVLKNGVIIANLDITTKPCFVFGRLSNCDLVLEHPSISRYHSLLQYRSISEEGQEKGWYLYDLGSTHGTFLNKQQLPPKVYCRVYSGHVFKLGVSTRMFVLQGPEGDQEAESSLTVTELIELKKKQNSLLNEFEDDKGTRKQDIAQTASSNGDTGISWGMKEDAQDENPMAENPFAGDYDGPVNEALDLDDPKKTLRGWFEREGHELEYKVEEKNYAHFVCQVELPIEANGRSSITAEAIVKGGKKKDAVVQCALEACRILDRHGLLRQANHQSKFQRKKKLYDEDHYSSDEDTFLDRTGAVERKRRAKLKAAGKISDSVETYDSLMIKYKEIENEMNEVKKQLTTASTNAAMKKSEDVDDLDAYITALQAEESNSQKSIPKLKAQLNQLQREENRLRTLINITKPAIIPELKPASGADQTSEIVETSVEHTLRQEETVVKEQPQDEQPQKEQDSSKKEIVKEIVEKVQIDATVSPVKKPADHQPEKRSKRPAVGPLMSPSLIEHLKKEEQEEKKKGKLVETQEMDEDEGLAEKSGLVIRKRKKINKSPAVTKVSSV